MRAEHLFYETQNENYSQNHLIAGEGDLEKHHAFEQIV